MEGGPVDTPVMPLEDVLDDGITATKQVGVHLLRQAEHVLPTAGREALLPERSNVPHTDGLIQRRRHHQVLLGVKLRAHDIVVVAREHADACAALPIPHADGLVVGCGDDPGMLVVKLHRSDVVQVAQQREEAPADFVVPDLDLVVVTARDKEGLAAVKVHATHRAIVLVKAIDQGAHAIVP